MSKFVRLPLVIFSLLALSTIAFAQSTLTGGISGKVTDPQGASIPNAAVTATNAGTNKEATATSDNDGGFRVVNLEPGSYTVKVTVAGFADFVQEKVVVEVGQITSLIVPLGVAGTTATVEITAEAPVINTNSQEFSTNINQTSINELPVNGRRVTDFVLLTPASVPDGPFGLISFRGISGLLNNSTVDGGDNNQSFQSEERGRTRIPYVVSQSAVREFQVNSSNYSAEYGRSAGAVVNTVSKSGTNEFHGDLFEYYRNNKFGARNPRAFQSVLINGISTPVGIKPLDIRHQFGGDIGGPIVKNKAFFFFSYDQQKRNFPGLAVFFAPGYLNTLAAGTTGRAALTAATATKGLTDAQIDNALNFLTSTTGETPRRGDQKIIFPKFDWQVNSNNLFTLSYNRLRWASPAGLQTQATNTNARHSFGDDFVRVDTINSRFQSTLTPNLLNEARFQYSKDFEFAFSQPPLPGEPSTATTELGARSPQVFLTNGLTFGTTTNFERIKYPDERRIQFADTVTWTKGVNTIKFGADFNHVTDEILNRASEAGSYSYSNISDFVIDYVNFVTPLPATVTCSTTTRLRGRCYTSTYVQGVGIQGIKFKEDEYSFFAQLDTRVTPRFTLNSGLRYEYQKLPAAILPNSSTLVIPNDGRTLNQATSTLPNDKNNWGPRVGFAYDVNGDGKTSVRGGFGVYYGRILGGHIWNNLLKTGNLGGQGTITVAQTQITNCTPLVPTATVPCAPIFPNVLPNTTSLTSAGTIFFFQRNFQTPKILQYDFILEREIAKNTVASASFVGARGYDLPTFVDVNLGLTGASKTYTILGGAEDGQTFTVAQYAKAISTQASMLREESSVKSEYSALVLQVNRRFTNGLQFQSSYTFSKATDTGQNSLITTSIFNQPVDVFQRQAYDFGPTNFDTRHKFVFSAVYAPTLYKGGAGSARDRLINGWSVSPIFVLYSGTPYSATVSGVTNGLNGSNGDFRYFRLPRNSFRLPAIKNMDLRVSKRINFSERYNVELLGEAFNLFNRTQVFGKTSALYTSSSTTCTVNGVSVPVPAPGNGLCFNTAFGAVSSTDSNKYSQRQIQFAVRFHF